ncbi:hypothetical protein R6Z07F_018010 [Ovis aries]
MLNGGPEKTCGISVQLGRWAGLADGGDTVSPAGTRQSPYWGVMHHDKEATEKEGVLEPSLCQAFPNTNCWFLTHMNQPQFRAILRELKLCEKMARLDPKRFAESQPKKHTNWKEKRS